MEPPRTLPESFAQQLAEVQQRIDASNQRLLETHRLLIRGQTALGESRALLEQVQRPSAAR